MSPWSGSSYYKKDLWQYVCANMLVINFIQVRLQDVFVLLIQEVFCWTLASFIMGVRIKFLR